MVRQAHHERHAGDARFLPPQERRGGGDTRPYRGRGRGAYAGRRRRTAIADGVGGSAPARGGRGTWRKGYGVPASAGTTVAGVAWPTLAHFGAPWAARRRGPRLRGESTEEVRGRQRRPRAARISAPQAGCRPSCASVSIPAVRERGCEVPASARAEARERRRPNPPHCLWIPAFAGMTEASRLSC